MRVSFRGVSKSYGGRDFALRDLNIDVQEGELLTLLGPSGSGKTTCLMLLAGFESPSSGTLLLEGVAIDGVPAYRRNIGMVFQNYALFPHMTVAENLAFPLSVRGIGKAEIARGVEAALKMVRLEDLGRRRPNQLSGGQQQRVALARALIFKPALVLMDEPLAALDRELREQMQYEIRRLQQDLRITMIYVTHDQQEALRMSDRIAVFERGVLRQVARPRDLYERPESAFVARFVGENNGLFGQVESIDGTVCRVLMPDGSRVSASASRGLVPGQRVFLSLRPERVRQAGDSPLENRFTGRVSDFEYLGDRLRVRLPLLGREDFSLMFPSGNGPHDLTAGSSMTVEWRTEDCHALAE